MTSNLIDFVAIVGGAVLCAWLLYYACTGNIREYERKKRAEANGGEEYVSTAWGGRKKI